MNKLTAQIITLVNNCTEVFCVSRSVSESLYQDSEDPIKLFEYLMKEAEITDALYIAEVQLWQNGDDGPDIIKVWSAVNGDFDDLI